MQVISEPVRRARMRMTAWCSPFTAPVPAEVRAPLVRLQHERLRKSLPLLCLAIAANAIAMALAVMGDLPVWQQVAPPLIIVGACLVLLVRGWRRRPPAGEQAAYRELRNSLFVTVPLGIIAGLWCVNAFVETEQYYCMTAPVFIGIAALVSANCLIAVPRAALGGMIATVAPVAVKMSLYPNLGIRAMAAMMVVIVLMQSRVVLNAFRETVGMLTAQQELDRLARSDALTGLAGRRAFLAALEARLADERPVLVALADLDGFKQANDGHGHSAGDAVLVGVAERLRAAAPNAAMIARLGGDEFALLFDVDDPRGIGGDIEAARQAIAMPFVFGEARIAITASIGTATSPRDGTDIFGLLHIADLAMYADKAAGRVRRAMPERRQAA
jgi:diguanylate cyclase (GGDEF)-like protein